MTTSSAINTDIESFIETQNAVRSTVTLAGGAAEPLDYDALTGTVPAGGNAVTGIAGIAAGAAAISLPTSTIGNAVIFDGGVSTAASTSGADSYSFTVATTGSITVTDNNTGYSQAITGAEYLIFDGGAIASSGAYQSVYMIESGTNAEVAELYNAALGRQPDLAGLEYYAIPITSGALTIQQAAANFIASPEFTTKFTAASLSLDNGGAHDQAYITQLYENVLHRNPAASELAWYVNDIQTTLAGTTNYRAVLLINFATSPEDQADVSSWLINPANGSVTEGSAPVGTMTASSVVNNGENGGTLNLTTVDPSTLTSAAISADNQIKISPASPSTGFSQPFITDQEASGTVDLSSAINEFVSTTLTSTITVNGSATGGSVIALGSGTANLFGAGNYVENPASAPTTTLITVNGFTASDTLHFYDIPVTPTPIVETPSSTAPLAGSTLNFFMNNAYVVEVGTISAATAAAVATAATAVYTPSGSSGEEIIFVGETVSGNAVLFDWHGVGSKTIQASEMYGGIELVGVQASSLVAANFTGIHS